MSVLSDVLLCELEKLCTGGPVLLFDCEPEKSVSTGGGPVLSDVTDVVFCDPEKSVSAEGGPVLSDVTDVVF